MGRLSIVKSVYGKREVVSIVYKLLSQQGGAQAARMRPEVVSETLVDLVWEPNVALIKGSAEPLPHRKVLAALALAAGFSQLSESDISRHALTIALSNVLADIEVNGCHPFSDFDRQLIATVMETFTTMLAEYNNDAVAN